MIATSDIRMGGWHVTFGEVTEEMERGLSTTPTIIHVSPTCFCCLRTCTRRSTTTESLEVFCRPVHSIFTSGSAPSQPSRTVQSQFGTGAYLTSIRRIGQAAVETRGCQEESYVTIPPLRLRWNTANRPSNSTKTVGSSNDVPILLVTIPVSSARLRCGHGLGLWDSTNRVSHWDKANEHSL
jgi:hypothetical protein